MPERSIRKQYYKLEVIDNGIRYLSVERSSPLEAHAALQIELRNLYRDRGIRIPSTAVVQGETGRRIGPIRFGITHLGSRPLIPEI